MGRNNPTSSTFLVGRFYIPNWIPNRCLTGKIVTALQTQINGKHLITDVGTRNPNTYRQLVVGVLCVRLGRQSYFGTTTTWRCLRTQHISWRCWLESDGTMSARTTADGAGVLNADYSFSARWQCKEAHAWYISVSVLLLSAAVGLVCHCRRSESGIGELRLLDKTRSCDFTELGNVKMCRAWILRILWSWWAAILFIYLNIERWKQNLVNAFSLLYYITAENVKFFFVSINKKCERQERK